MPAKTAHQWELTDHCCRACFGRVLRREADDGERLVYRCANCGAEAEGRRESVLCCCGIKLKTGADAGIRCVVNNAPSPECPSQIVAEQVAADFKSVGLAPRS